MTADPPWLRRFRRRADNANGHEQTRFSGSDRLACFLAENTHKAAQELLHKPESAVHLVLTGQNRNLVWPGALTRSLSQSGVGFCNLFPKGGILLGEPINLSLQRGLLIRDQAALIAAWTPCALAYRT